MSLGIDGPKLPSQIVVRRNVPHPSNVRPHRFSQRSVSDEDWAAIQKRQRTAYIYRALFGALVIGATGWLLLTRGAPPTQSDIDAHALRAPIAVKPFRATYPVDPSILFGIDMAKVHAQLLPAWVIALQHRPHSIGHRQAEEAYSALLDEAGKDANLGVLLDRLHAKLMEGTYDFNGEIQALFKGWNEYLARSGVPFRLEHHIDKTVRGPELRVRCYRVIADVALHVEQSTPHVLLLTRQDKTNLVEAFLGQTATDRGTALVVVDRIAEYAVDRLWPLFDSNEELPESALLAQVRTEARRALGQPVVNVLARTYAVHHALENDLASLAQRRGCGAGVLIERVPWDGLSERALAMVNRVAQKNDRRRCPRVTLGDADRIQTVSQQLREHAELAPALGLLGGWLAKAVVAHEARHLADDLAATEAASNGLCRGCPESFDWKGRAEVSAYLASFATDGVGYVALFQACGIATDRRESHSAALGFLLPKLLASGCMGPVPDDLYTRAAAMRNELFGSNAPIELPKNFPSAIPIPRD